MRAAGAAFLLSNETRSLTAMVNRQAVQGKLEGRLSRTPGRAETFIIDR